MVAMTATLGSVAHYSIYTVATLGSVAHYATLLH